MAKTNFGKMKDLSKNMRLSMQLSLSKLKSYIWSGLLYGCENWTFKSDMKKKLEVVKIWSMKRMLRVPLIARRTNLAVLEMASTSKQLMTTIRRRQLRCLYHTLRGTSLETVCLLRKIEGTRSRGRQRLNTFPSEVNC